ncbi:MULTISPECIES: Rne/Rng family ribonuclease [Kocuria]|nr:MULTISPECIES: Rne/Rng family ribonuclease [Kocuria]
MTNDQVNQASEGSEFPADEHTSNTPTVAASVTPVEPAAEAPADASAEAPAEIQAETPAESPAEAAYQALQEAEARGGQDVAQTELPLDESTEAPSTETLSTEAPENEAPVSDAPADGEEQAEDPAVKPEESVESADSSESAESSESPESADSPEDAPESDDDEQTESDEQAGSEEQTDSDDQADADGRTDLDAQTDSNDQADSDDAPGQADPFAVFSAASATSLMFHAPDTDAIKAAAERAAVAREEARQAAIEEAEAAEEAEFEDPEPGAGVTSKRRRRRRRGSVDMELEGGNDDDPPGTVTRIRTGRVVDSSAPTTVQSVKGSTRLEAKKQRRRESRQSGRRRQVITEAEFLARRESVERKMVVREKDDRIQIGVLEDGVLAEHFVSHTQQDSLIGNVYLGKVQNVLPSMEAAFVDIGRGRNAVLYAGEVNWDDADLGGSAKRIENALKPGDSVLVQVTKDPVGHKGARLTSQVSLPGRYLVYVPGGSMTGISRKLPDVERQRLKKILKDHLPEGAGVIVRTAAEGASEQELTNDINRLRSQWEQIQEKSAKGKTLAPELLYAEPDLTIKTVRDVFNEDFTSMTVQGEAAWDNIEAYVMYVAPDLLDRVSQWTEDEDLFEHFQVDEQIYKALDRKVMLPSGGSLVIDRTEAMTVVDVNTGKFTGSGGNLEETVTKNNLEAAEEIVRQLRLRDIGGIIVIDFIDMVLEANRDLVLRRLVECLGRDRTKHQVAEVTSLGLVQMTRKRMGTGLLEIFSEPCEACDSRGVVIHDHPLKGKGGISTDSSRRDRNERKRNRRSNTSNNSSSDQNSAGSDSSAAPEDPEQAKRAQATRNAFAAIASASHHDDDAPAKDAEGAGTDDSQTVQENGETSAEANGAGAGKGSQRRKKSGSSKQSEPESETAEVTDQGGETGPDDGREGNKRRRKRRGKRSRNRGQNDSENRTASSEGEGRDRDAAPEPTTESSSDSAVANSAGADSAGADAPKEAAAKGEPAKKQNTEPVAPMQREQPRRRTRGARRAAAPVGTPEKADAPAVAAVTVTAGTAVAVTGGREDQSKVTINGQVIDLPYGSGGAPSTQPAGSDQSAVASLDSLADSLGERGPQQPSARKPRRSRRASAPAAAPRADAE